jgi:hypothetical protein
MLAQLGARPGGRPGATRARRADETSSLGGVTNQTPSPRAARCHGVEPLSRPQPGRRAAEPSPTREADMSATTATAGATAIRPFHIEVPQEEIDALRRGCRRRAGLEGDGVEHLVVREDLLGLAPGVRPGARRRSATSSTGTRSTRAATSPLGAAAAFSEEVRAAFRSLR